MSEFGDAGIPHGHAAWRPAFEQALASGLFEHAHRLLLDVLRENPNDLDAQWCTARTFLAQDNHQAALDTTARALGQAPNSDTLHACHGDALMGLGRFAGAEQAYRTALEINPSEADHLSDYAFLLWSTGELKPALELVERGLALAPEGEGLLTMRAGLLTRLSPADWAVNREAVERALRINPMSANNHAILGAILMQAGDHQAAEESFHSALHIDPHNSFALRGLTQLLMATRWWYRPMLAYNIWMDRFGQQTRILFILGLWALYSSVSSTLPEGLSYLKQPLLVAYLSFCAYTWFAPQIAFRLLRGAYPWMEDSFSV